MKDLAYKLVCKLDKETSRLCNKIKNHLKPLKDEKVPSIPFSAFTRGYESFSGTDIKCYILDLDQELYEEHDGVRFKNGAAGWVQAFEFHGGEFPTGTLTAIILDDMKDLHRLLGKEKRLIIEAANEYGNYAILYNGVVEFDKALKWAMSIDDIICEVRLDFYQVSEKLDIEEGETDGQEEKR